MPTDWKQKLAWVLRDLPDESLDLLQLSSHRSALLGGEDVETDLGAHGQWLHSSADRVPFPKGKAGSPVKVDWAASPEVTHPTAKQRKVLEQVDLDVVRQQVSALVAEASKRYGGDARRLFWWLWRYLPERLAGASEELGGMAVRIPADPRLPNLSVWHRMGFDAALVGAGPSPCFLVVQALPTTPALRDAASLGDVWAASAIDAELMWRSMLPVIEELGPEAVLAPTGYGHPRVDAWLADQGVTSSDEAGAPSPSERMVGDLPQQFVALVPSDRAREIGEACKERFNRAWLEMASKVRDELVAQGWAAPSDEAWASIWARQTSRAWEVTWTAVAWGEDSTGAGSLLPKQEVSALEKWARVQEDAAGLDEAWPGIYFGLWYDAAVAAAGARRQMGSVSVPCEPDRPCTACGCREALHGGTVESDDAAVAEFWELIAGPGGKAGGEVCQGESLCAVCTMRRMAAKVGIVADSDVLGSLVSSARSYAVVWFGLDQPGMLQRGGKELKHAATLADCVHSSLSKSFTKRARSHVKEILDSAPPLGPARQMAVQEARQTFLSATLPTVLHQFGAVAVHVGDGDLVSVVPVEHAYGFVRALRDRIREPFVQVDTPSGRRWGIHVGPQYPCSGLIAMVPAAEVVGPLWEDCRALLGKVARAALDGDALVVLRRGAGEPERLYAARWDDLPASLDVVLRAVPDPAIRTRMVDALWPVAPALANSDLDKASSTARAHLVRNALQDAGIPMEGADVDVGAMARAVCQLVDHRVRLSNGLEEGHALDGLRVATSLRGVDR